SNMHIKNLIPRSKFMFESCSEMEASMSRHDDEFENKVDEVLDSQEEVDVGPQVIATPEDMCLFNCVGREKNELKEVLLALKSRGTQGFILLFPKSSEQTRGERWLAIKRMKSKWFIFCNMMWTSAPCHYHFCLGPSYRVY
ncbi:hypothetical protein GIB67_012549, partial [Kingdonia uniflora]